MAGLQSSPMQIGLQHDIGGMSPTFDRFYPRYGRSG